jgi:VCBS repeat-containing protein
VGSTTADSEAVAVRADEAYVQGTTTVTAAISGTTGGNFEALDTTSTASTSVHDDSDKTTVTLTASTASVMEGESVTYTATVDHAPQGGNLVLTLSTGDTLTILANETSGHSTPVTMGNVSVDTPLTVRITSANGGNYELLNTTSTTRFTVTDSVPVANDDFNSVNEGGNRVVGNDVVLMIDRSGSMSGTSMTDLKASVLALFQSGTVHSVFITSFSDTATFHNSGSNDGWYTNLTDAYAAVNGIRASGNTNYDLALSTVTDNFKAPPIGGDRLVSMFMSDGQPNTTTGSSGTDGIVGTEEGAWIKFLTDNHFSDSYAVGFSGLTDADKNFLEPIAWNSSEVAGTYTTGEADPNVFVVAAASDLTDVLMRTIGTTNTITGDILTNDVAGVDGPITLVSVTVGADAPLVFDGSHTSYTITVAGAGTLTINNLGHYSFTAVSSVTSNMPVSVGYMIEDADGDPSTAQLNITVVDSVPVANLDTAVATEGHWIAGADVIDQVGVTVTPASWGSLATTTTNTTWSANPSAGHPATVTSSNFVLAADSGHLADVSVKVNLTGFSSGNDSFSVGLYNASNILVGSSQSFTAAGTATFTGINAAGTYYLKAIGAEGSSGSDNFKFDINTLVVKAYAYTPEGTTPITVTTPDATWVAAGVATGNVMTNDVAGVDGGLHVTQVVTSLGTTDVPSGAGGVDVAGEYGTLHIADSGAYMYTPNAMDMVLPAGAHESFNYTVQDADHSPATSILTVNLTDYAYTGTSTAGNDFVGGTDGNDLLSAGSGNDVVYGAAGNDTLNGGEGNDRLIGGAGDDVLIGGTGNDVLQGGTGADTFVWRLADLGNSSSPAHDVVTDFNTAEGDVLNLTDVLSTGYSLTAVANGGHLVLQIQDASHNMLQDITLQSINAADNTAAASALAAMLLTPQILPHG